MVHIPNTKFFESHKYENIHTEGIARVRYNSHAEAKNLRILAGTNRNLESALSEGRNDLQKTSPSEIIPNYNHKFKEIHNVS